MNIKQLISLADYLDESGAHEEANKIDILVREAAEEENILDLFKDNPEMAERLKNMPGATIPPDSPSFPARPGSPMEGTYDQPDEEEPLAGTESDEEYMSRVMNESPSLEQHTSHIQEGLSSYLANPNSSKSYYDLLDALKQYQVRWQAENKSVPPKGESFMPEDEETTAARKSIFEKLSNIADRLDSVGALKEADAVDAFISKYAIKDGDDCPRCKGQQYTGALGDTCSACEGSGVYQDDRTDEERYEDQEQEYDEQQEGMGDVSEVMKDIEKEWKELEQKMNKAGLKFTLMKEADGVYDVVDWQDEADTEQSKRYDSKYHHEMQVRKNEERSDHEGYDDTHHVNTYQPVKKEAASTRYCPEHVGVMLGRVAESTYQCPLDGATYNWEVGWKDYDGKQHAGGSVAAQTPDSAGIEISHRIFDSRNKG